jgi:RNA polymerase sigma-70 factor (ECF subfamily)
MSPEAVVADLRRELIVWLTRKGGAAADVEDVVQDAFLRFQRAGHQLGSPDARPLLFVIARNLQHDRWKAESRALRRHTDDGVHALDAGPRALASEARPADEHLIHRQNLTAAAAVIRALPPRCREAFLLHRFEALTYRQIAARLGVSVSMVEKYVAEALRQLKKSRED